jgi:NarL family two-component system response regulator LiaR
MRCERTVALGATKHSGAEYAAADGPCRRGSTQMDDRIRDAANGSAGVEPPPASDDQHIITVLLADDHALVREGTRRLLEAEPDFRVVAEAGTGLDAVQEAERTIPDVAIMDVAMPGMSGIEATRRIKASCPSVAVLALTAYDDEQYVLALLDAGAAGFMLKDTGSRELIEAVRAVARGEAVLQPHLAARAVRHAISRQTAAALSGAAAQPPLSDREMDVLREASHGLPNKDIARRLNLSVRTVHTHLGNIFAKLNVGSRTEAVLLALRRGWISLEDTELPPEEQSGRQTMPPITQSPVSTSTVAQNNSEREGES